MTYQSSFSVASCCHPGVRLTVRRVSVARRLELLRKVRDLAARMDFYQAGAQLDDKLEASIASAEIESLYVTWGISQVEGLNIDGHDATPELLVACGPEDLVREAATLVRSQLGLSEDERKN
ncbi:MAG TPA: hypothetical protein VGL72_25760 [Bryobacteraceae bacterium]|jgi:hypothetical protein